MGQIRYKLQNILLEDSRLPEECRPMLYRGDTFGYDKLLSAHTLRPGQTADFLTYFNACSAAKWYRCTVIDNLSVCSCSAVLWTAALSRKNIPKPSNITYATKQRFPYRYRHISAIW